MKAWWFAPEGEVLDYGDGRKITVGKMHTVKGTPELCRCGLHGSVNLSDALEFAQSATLYRVEITRKIVEGLNKVVGQRRKYLVRLDATDVLRKFARQQALINIALLMPHTTPEKYALLVEYLETGKEELRAAAEAAARDAAWDAARDAAWDAAWAATGAAWDAARVAAWAAARVAARDAAEAAARGAARVAAEAAANKMLTEMVLEELSKQGYTEEGK